MVGAKDYLSSKAWSVKSRGLIAWNLPFLGLVPRTNAGMLLEGCRIEPTSVVIIARLPCTAWVRLYRFQRSDIHGDRYYCTIGNSRTVVASLAETQIEMLSPQCLDRDVIQLPCSPNISAASSSRRMKPRKPVASLPIPLPP